MVDKTNLFYYVNTNELITYSYRIFHMLTDIVYVYTVHYQFK